MTDAPHDHSAGPCRPGCPAFFVVARVWQRGLFSWWAEVWTPGGYSPFKAPPDSSRPEPVPGCTRVGLALRRTRPAAERAARRMADRVERGLDADHDRPTAEIVAR